MTFRYRLATVFCGLAMTLCIQAPASVLLGVFLPHVCHAFSKLVAGRVTPENYRYASGFDPARWEKLLEEPSIEAPEVVGAITRLTKEGNLTRHQFLQMAATTLPRVQRAGGSPPSQAKLTLEALIAASRLYDLTPSERAELRNGLRRELGKGFYDHPDTDALRDKIETVELGMPVPAGEVRLEIVRGKDERMFNSDYFAIKHTGQGWTVANSYGNSVAKTRVTSDGGLEYLGSFEIKHYSFPPTSRRPLIRLSPKEQGAELAGYGVIQEPESWARGLAGTPEARPDYRYRLEVTSEDTVVVSSLENEPHLEGQFKDFLVKVQGNQVTIETLRDSDRGFRNRRVFRAELALPKDEKLSLAKDKQKIFELLAFVIPHMRERALDY